LLKSFDILLGFIVVMLIASMAVTVLTQIWTTLLNLRGAHLRDGLVDLLTQLHSTLSPADSRPIVQHLLTHPLIRDGGKLGSLIHRDELIGLLLEAATGQGPHALPDLARTALLAALSKNGVPEPAAVLHRIRETALQIEAATPALATAARHDLAILQAASSEFVAKINSSFDRMIDRVSVRFTISIRRITLINAVLVAALLQMDAVSIVNRLANDDSLRSVLFEKAYAQEKLSAMDPHQLASLAGHDILPIPATAAEWRDRWHPVNLPGVALSVLLLSLGAPFWFGALKNMLRLRSLIAEKDDAQRALRA